MTRSIAFLLVAWAALVVLSALMGALPLSWGGRFAAPDVLLLVAMFVGLAARESVVSACVLGLLLGYLGDLFSGAPKGLHMVVYPVAVLAARAATTRLMVRGRVATALSAAVFALVFGVLIATLRASFDPDAGWGALREVPAMALATAVVAPLMFRILGRLEKSFVRETRGLGAS